VTGGCDAYGPSQFREINSEEVLSIGQEANVHAPAAPSPVVLFEARDLLFGGANVSHHLQQHSPTLNGPPVTQHGLGVYVQRVHGICAIAPISLEVDDDLVHCSEVMRNYKGSPRVYAGLSRDCQDQPEISDAEKCNQAKTKGEASCISKWRVAGSMCMFFIIQDEPPHEYQAAQN
jgi:hypothetical protein